MTNPIGDSITIRRSEQLDLSYKQHKQSAISAWNDCRDLVTTELKRLREEMNSYQETFYYHANQMIAQKFEHYGIIKKR
jgi:hypothetical protein